MDIQWLIDREKVLDYFAKQVAAKKFKKMVYNIWYDLKNRWEESTLLVDRYDSYINITGLNFSSGTLAVTHKQSFYRGDKSFGDFLYENWGAPYLTRDMISTGVISNLDLNNVNTLGAYKTDTATNLNSGTANNNYTYSTTTIPYSNICTANDYTIQWPQSLNEQCKKIVDEYLDEKEKENNKVDTSNMFNFEFGPVSDNQFRMSPYGLAIRTANNGWVAYSKTDELINVDVINFDMSKLIYKMPVPLSAVKAGDILMHSKKPVFVRSVNADGTVSVIDYSNAAISNILPVKSPFGFNFLTKICALIDIDSIGADVENPFGSMLPFLVLSNSENNGNIDTSMLLAMSMMSGQGMDFSKNPMMLYFLMNNKDKNDMLPFILMMNGNMWGTASAAPATS